MKNVTFRVLFTEGGTLWERGTKKVPKSWVDPFGSYFSEKVEIRTLLKTLNSRLPPTRPKSGIWAPKVPKREHFGCLLNTFSGTGVKSENGVLA